MALSKILGGLLAPATNVLSEFIEDKDKRLEAQTRLTELVLASEDNIVNAARDVVVAEAKSDSWLTRSWRPIVMLTFTALIVAHWMGFTSPNVTEPVQIEILEIVKLGLTGYVIGRSAQDIAKSVAPALGKK